MYIYIYSQGNCVAWRDSYVSELMQHIPVHRWIVFSCSCSLVRPHGSGCPFPSPHLKALGSATEGQARDRDPRAALGNPQDKRHII